MRNTVTIDNVTLIREQVERAFKELNAPDPPESLKTGQRIHWRGSQDWYRVVSVHSIKDGENTPLPGKAHLLHKKNNRVYLNFDVKEAFRVGSCECER